MDVSPPIETAAMCLGIPMQIIEIDGPNARCHARGIERQVNLFLLADQAPAVGDYVMVHVGYAIQKIAPREALTSWELYDQMTHDRGTGPGHA